MNLIIDIGNTRAKLAVLDRGEVVATVATDHDLTALPQLTAQYACQRGILSTTAGVTEGAEQRLQVLEFPLLRLTGTTPTPIKVCYHTPQTLGTDRLAAAVGAWARCPGRHLLIIDAGTCITYDYVDSGGNYLGGNISPGLEMRLTALHRLTARLPQVGREGDVPEIGYNTETAIRSGVVRGILCEIEGVIARFRKKYSSVSVFLTGGDAINLDMSAKSCIFAAENGVLTDDGLVLRGLDNILDYNK